MVHRATVIIWQLWVTGILATELELSRTEIMKFVVNEQYTNILSFSLNMNILLPIGDISTHLFCPNSSYYKYTCMTVLMKSATVLE